MGSSKLILNVLLRLTRYFCPKAPGSFAWVLVQFMIYCLEGVEERCEY